MICACRASPWRAFIQGLVQVHRLDHASVRLGQLQPRTSDDCLRRSFRTLQSRRQATAEAAPTSKASDLGLSASELDRLHRSAARDGPPNRTERSLESSSAYSMTASSTETPPSKTAFARHAQGGFETKAARRNPRRDPVQLFISHTQTQASLSIDHDRMGPASTPPKQKPVWQVQKQSLREKFPEGWRPRKKLSPDALAGIRALNAQFPDVYTTQALASKFEVSPEAIRRILRSKWQASPDEEEDRQQRWFRRGKQVWEYKAELGVKPPRRWRQEGIVRSPEYHVRSKETARREREIDEDEVRRYRASRANVGPKK